MNFPELLPATLIRRYKRFLADVMLSDGRELTVHCPNTGAMTGCAEPGSRVWLRDSEADGSRRGKPRKYRYSWELVENSEGDLACIHSARANALVAEALDAGLISELRGYPQRLAEVRYGTEASRIDWLLQDESRDQQCFVEVKSVTLHRGGGLGLFPDAVSQRASRHLRELMAVAADGHRAVLLFCAQHTGIRRLAPADSIDPTYAATLREAADAGVELLGYGCKISPRAIALTTALPVSTRETLSHLRQ